MKTSPIIELKNKLISDTDYIKYENIYRNENIVDKELLIKLLNKHIDLYLVFLKMNIFLYRYDTKGLSKNLKDYNHYKEKMVRINDLSVVFRLYYRNYNRTRNAIKKIITYKLRPMCEINLLKKILNRPVEEEIYSIYEYDEHITNEREQ